MRYPIERAGETTRVRLSGEIALGVADDALRTLADAVLDDRPQRVVVDLSAVSLLDSIGIGALAAARTMATSHGCSFVVTNPRSAVRRVLATTGMLEVLLDPTGPVVEH